MFIYCCNYVHALVWCRVYKTKSKFIKIVKLQRVSFCNQSSKTKAGTLPRLEPDSLTF